LTSFYAFRHLAHLQPTKLDHCPLLFFGANEIGIVHVYGKKLMTEMDYLHHNGRRGVDHVYFVMPNQQYSQLKTM
jgi:hypothetical protein